MHEVPNGQTVRFEDGLSCSCSYCRANETYLPAFVLPWPGHESDILLHRELSGPSICLLLTACSPEQVTPFAAAGNSLDASWGHSHLSTFPQASITTVVTATSGSGATVWL